MAIGRQHLPVDSSTCLAPSLVARAVRVSGALCCSIASGLDWLSEVLSSKVDRLPSTRELNFIVTATSGPCTVSLIAGEDWTTTACAETTRGTSVTTSDNGH